MTREGRGSSGPAAAPRGGETPPGTVLEGRPWPLGVSFGAEGANLAVVTSADALDLCLFDEAGRVETARLRLPGRSDGVAHGLVPGLRPGAIYGLRAHGPWAPERGQRFNPAKLLLDPFARAVAGRLVWAGPNLVDPEDPFTLDPRDSAPYVPKGVVTRAPAPAPPGRHRPWPGSVLYEAHVKGLTRLHPAVPEARRGTYAALAHPAVLDHLVKLGVTTVELMPVAAFLDELHLARKGLVNHWGYNPLAFMAPEPRYAEAGADPTAELAAAIAGLHAAGLEVILDIVVNHTAETDHLGPTLSFRGLDNALYYRLDDRDPRRYQDMAGCGNTLATHEPRVTQLVMEALRHWAALGVDGFRFDLAPVLGRGRDGGFTAEAPLLQAIRQDPVLGGLKLVAEPWDLGSGGYRLGEFPPPFAEWNDRFRDGVRRFWRGDEGVGPELARAILGSADLFDHGGRKSHATVNFVTAHDGPTLADLVAYAGRHNLANGEGNRDGHGQTFSVNHGVEGPTAEPAVLAARARHARNLLATLLLAQGTPMLSMGDELLRSQAGNTNAYCQDNPTSWLAWPDPAAAADGPAATARLVARVLELRRAHGLLGEAAFLHGRVQDAWGVPDVLWLGPDGRPLDEAAWRAPGLQRIVLLLNGRARRPEGAPLLLVMNAASVAERILLPDLPEVAGWRVLLDTTRADGIPADGEPARSPGAALVVAGPSLLLLQGEPAESTASVLGAP